MNLKLIFITLALAATARAEISKELMDSLLAAQEKAQAAMDAGTNQGSRLLQGTWTITKRFCVSGFTQAEFDQPTQVFDMLYYYNVINYNGNYEIFTTTNADRTPENHCVSQAGGSISMVPVDLKNAGLKISEVIVLKTQERRKVSSCAAAYKGPSLAKVFNVVKVDENSAYFFLLPGQFAGSASSCANPKDFNVEFAIRVPDLKP